MSSFVNAIRDAMIHPEERRNREDIKRIFEIIKVATLVTAAVSVLFLAIFPKLITIILVSVIGFIAYEARQVANNYLEILNNVTVEITARTSKENFFNQLGKNTLLAGSIIKIINPPVGTLDNLDR